MKRFKSVSKKKKIQRQIIIFLLEIIISLLIVIFIKNNFKLSESKIKYLTYSYLGKMERKKEMIKNEIKVFNERAPNVYIYNTHQTEKYAYNKVNSYNLDYDVYFASFILKSYLNDFGILSIIENEKVSKVLSDKGLTYKDSYIASRYLLEKAKENNNDLKYFIDLHRDSATYEMTTCKYDGKSYAKILFVLGMEFEGYGENEKMINYLNEKLKSINPCLSRGVSKKSGKGVNGIYNEDFDKNLILIEVGGQYNNIIEVSNTLEIFAKILSLYINEDSNEKT